MFGPTRRTLWTNATTDSAMNDDSSFPDNFTGVVRLFPLPNVVLFPHVVQPLHIFEPRYRQMTADALDNDRLLAPALLHPGWEGAYESRPAIHAIVCVGKIVGDQCLSDGRYNLLLRGLSRARVLEEIKDDKPYRSARVEVLPDGVSPPKDLARALHKQLGEVVRPWFPVRGPALEQLQELLKSELPLAVLCDILGFAVPLAVAVKQRLLEERDVAERAHALIKHLRREPEQTPAVPKFPPGFSTN